MPGGEPLYVDLGRAALDRGDWVGARKAFEAALEAGEDPDALEGLAWAAWWLNDAASLFKARERAYLLYRERDDRVSAARVATWIASDCCDFRGEAAVARGWRQRARRLLDGLPDVPERAWLAFHEGAYALELEDDTATARERAVEASGVARGLGLGDVEVLALALEGLALVTEGAVDQGMRRLDEAGAAATGGEVRDRIVTTWTLCYLIYACERARDLDRAAQWCRRMEEISARLTFDLGLGVCRVHYAGVLMLRGEWARADTELARAGELLARLRPPLVAESTARLGELRRRQGRVEEAARLFERSGPHPIAVLGRAAVALDAGDAATAAETVGDLLAAIPGVSITQRADALEILSRARVRLGDLDGATASAAELADVAGAIGTNPLRAMAAAARGLVEAARQDPEGARRRFTEAVDLFERSGLPYEAARMRIELARTLQALGRAEAAVSQGAAAARRLRELGAVADAALAEALAGREEPATAPRARSALPGLTERETEVLRLVARGMSDREIALHLSISPHTVHRHVSNVLTKLALPSRAAAAAHAARHGLA